MSDEVMKTVDIEIKNHPELLNRLAQGYKYLSKTLMEYIDNSFDSADKFFDGKKYSREVLINVAIDREKQQITITDNCEGMAASELERLANSINQSQKGREQQNRIWVTGRFGLGAHAFRLFSEVLIVGSKTSGSKHEALSIHRDDQQAKFITPPVQIETSSGTAVQLTGVDKRELKSLSAKTLKQEMETYFEMLLRRNVSLTVSDGDQILKCEAFDYDAIPGTEIKRLITEWSVGTSKARVSDEKGVEVHLKIADKQINRPPFFSHKGRKISDIADLPSFMSRTKHRRKIWGHFLLTGYIEVKDNLEPVVTRDDFVTGRGRTPIRAGIYNEIVKLEDEIYEAIEDVNRHQTDSELQNLSSKLTDILSKLAKEDLLRLRYENQGDKTKKKGEVEGVKEDEDSADIWEIPGGEGTGPGPVEPGKKEIPGKQDPDSEVKGQKIDQQKEGMRIAFNTSPLPSPVRSHYGDGVITIFTAHPDFQARKSVTRLGELAHMTITPRLANYLAAVVSSEYKETFYQQKKLNPLRDEILNEQVDFIFKFEDMMKDFIDQPLNTIGKVGA